MMGSRTTKSVLIAVISAVLFISIISFLDLVLFREMDAASLSNVRHVPPNLVPIWLALPRLVTYGAAGAVYARVGFGDFVVGTVVSAVLILGYFLGIRFGGGIWVSNGLFAWLSTVVPIAAAPLGFVAGACLGRKRVVHSSAAITSRPR